MDKSDAELVAWIQQHTESRVTSNFLLALQKISNNNKNDLKNFIIGCKALGKFHGEELFLSKLFERLKGEQKVSFDGAEAKPEQSRYRKLTTKVRLPINFDEEDVDDNIDNLLGKKKVVTGRQQDDSAYAQLPKLSFKKIDKNTAKKLKEYSSLKESESPSIRNEPHISKPFAISIPKLEAYSDDEVNEEYGTGNPSESEHESSSTFSDSATLLEDREWYNNDDDYGNPVLDEAIVTQELDFKHITPKHDIYPVKSQTEDALTSEIQVYALPMNKRKHLIPHFLKQYSASHGVTDAVVLGSFLESSNEGLINPFKNPESTFSINARKGSQLVALKRVANDQQSKSKETAEIVGTAIGDVLGVKDKDEELQDGKKPNGVGDAEALSREEIYRARQSLPAYEVKSQLVQMIRDNQVTVVIGETGSGKTTQLAQFLYEAGLCPGGKLIGCTQPRRVAAMSVAKRVALEMNVKIGQEVGYSIRFEDETSAVTKIKFMTDGILLREALLDEDLEKYSCVIIDEAHERSLNTDVIMGMLKRLLSKRRDLKLIITSATINAAKFTAFFGNAPHFTIPGRTFPIQMIYSKYPVEDYVEASVMQAIRIHMSTEVNSGDVLIFMTGHEDVEATSDTIKERLTDVYAKSKGISSFEEIDDVEIFTIYSALPGDVQNRIFQRLDSGKRKIVVATNIAETSLTIDGIRYVIDCGYSKLKVYNPKIGLDSLTVTPISIANANQRSGRAGRTAPGTAYRLYTEDIAHDDMYAQTIPEIQRTNLSNTVLLLKSLGVNDILQFPFIDPPQLQTLLASLYELFFIGALDNMGELTPLGIRMSKFPLQPSLCKILLIAAQNGCSEEMVTIVSMLSVPQVFYRPKERLKESDLARSRFFVPESDHLTLLNVYSQWKSNRFSHRWCSKNFLQFKSLQRAREIRDQFIKIMKKQGIELSSSGKEWDIIRKCICSGFAHQAAKISGLGKYVHLRTGMDIQLHPTSALYGMGDLPPYVVYHELLMTTKEYICCVTSVDPFWLMEHGGLLYDIKRVRSSNEAPYGGFEGSVTQAEEDDHLDYKLRSCINARNEMVRSLDDISQARLNNSKRVSNSGERRNPNQDVQIGFKKRRRPL